MGVLGGGGDPGGARLVVPSRLQVFLSRELFGWPLYGIILAFGQVRCCLIVHSGVVVTTGYFTDVERDQLSNRLALRCEHTVRSPTVHPWLGVFRFLGCLVLAVPFQVFGLGPFHSLVLLRRRLPSHRTSLHQRTL